MGLEEQGLGTAQISDLEASDNCLCGGSGEPPPCTGLTFGLHNCKTLMARPTP